MEYEGELNNIILGFTISENEHEQSVSIGTALFEELKSRKIV